ncbi:hypothetical protein J1C56_02460 [Aminobacter anthyllidis]|uniref:Single-stranded DNA-binding protein n=1 Tax=Aminobacter anthyllidis TaxID=1035067 RepID=A0A9X1A7Q6_9HYPH|nr:ssDNA-binding protein [Aminobacter anthyllidis]MBT1154447.1 hypothetical protein [Aminobacter anthyllidis]
MSKSELITLPKGEAVYPALSRPDTKFNDLGTYKANVRLKVDEALPTIKKIQTIAKAHLGKAMPAKDNKVWKYETDEDGNETGFVVFTIKVNNKLSKKTGKVWDRRPLVIDGKKKEIPADVNVWGGSVIRVQVEVYPYNLPNKGINLQPTIVQVIELVTGGGKGDTSAFDEEDGYEGEEGSDADTSGFDSEGDGSADDSDVDY